MVLEAPKLIPSGHKERLRIRTVLCTSMSLAEASERSSVPTRDIKLRKARKLVSASKGRDGVEVMLEGDYQFNWTRLEKWYFLEIKIDKVDLVPA